MPGPVSKIKEFEYMREGEVFKSTRTYSAIPAATTLNSEAILLRSIFNYAVQNDWISLGQIPDVGEKIPAAKRSRDSKRRPGLEPHEVKLLLEVAYKRMYEVKDNARPSTSA